MSCSDSSSNSEDDNVDKVTEDDIDNSILLLWDNVIVPYLENIKERQILDKITINDYNSFYEYMINNF